MEKIFKQDLIKILIDKFLIGILIVLLSFFVNLSIEKYKAKQALNQLLAEKRIAVLSYSWELVNTVQIEFNHTLSEWFHDDTDRNFESNSNLTEYIKQKTKIPFENRALLNVSFNKYQLTIQKQIETAQEYIKKNRFWLTEEEYVSLSSYIEQCKKYMQSNPISLSPEEHKKYLLKINKSRISVETVRDKLFRE